MEPPKPPQDIELRNIIDKLAQFVARNGPDFEQMTKTKQKGNTKFAFLFGGEYYSYYQYKVSTEQARLQASSPGPQNLGMNPPNPSGGNQWSGGVGGVGIPQMVVGSQLSSSSSNVIVGQAPPYQLTFPNPTAITIESITQQQNALHEQTSQSEQNLNAQHQVLIQQQQVQLEEAIRKQETETLNKEAEAAGINFAEFDVVLQPIIDTCTKDSISNGKAWILHRAVSPHANEILVQYLLQKITDPDKKFNQRLHLIYLVNDVLHHCARKHIEDFKLALEKVVVPMFSFTSLNVTDEQQGKLTKLINIWESKNHYFSDEIVAKLKEPVASWAEYKQAQLSKNTDLVEQLTNQTKASFQGFQSQHLAFVQHTLHQIQSLEQQKQLLEVAQKQQAAAAQAAAQQAAQAAAAAAAAAALQESQQQQMQQQMYSGDDYQENDEDGPPGVDNNDMEDSGRFSKRDHRDHRDQDGNSYMRRSYDTDFREDRYDRDDRFDRDERFNNSRDDRFNSSRDDRFGSGRGGGDSRYSGGSRDDSRYDREDRYERIERSRGGGGDWERERDGGEGRGEGRSIPQPPPPPPQPPQVQDNGGGPPAVFPDLGINLAQPPPGFVFNPPANIELPDITRPPPGFPPVIPPQPEVQPEDLLPSLPYYDLPAGLMAPLVKLEDSGYKPLDPDQIRLPPPAPPSERLLNAVKSFYSPPGHDHPRDSDGWEKLGLYEYYRAKANAKKRKEIEIHDGLRERSRSPTPVRSFFAGDKTPPPRRRYSSRSRSRSRERGNRRRSRRDRSSPPPHGRAQPPPPSLLQMPILAPPPGHPDHQSSKRSPSPPLFGGVGLGGGRIEPVEERLTESNKGHQLLKKMGWSGAGLGAKEQGIETPIASADVRDRSDQYKGVGINLNDPYENFRKSKGQAFITRMKARAEERAS